jgi:hypothetical protein
VTGPAVLADAVLVVHGLFIVWAAVGGLAVWRWPRLAIAHLPALAWAVWIEASGGICPLTPLENSLRRAAGQVGYSGGFIDHYLGPIVYPAGLTRETQWLVAGALLLVNAVAYGMIGVRARKSRRQV